MKQTFAPSEFVRRVGLDLVHAFDNARQATTPGLVGDAMEQPVRDRLEQILPRGIGVGSGCIIDTKGGTSRQMDIILYEKGHCPVFCVNNSPETTYYPAEGVLAVGEIKSRIGKKELADGFRKLSSVKALERAFGKTEDGLYIGRRYGDLGTASAYGFHRNDTNIGDIFGFILAEKARLPVTLPNPSRQHKYALKATLLGHYSNNVKEIENDVLSPDLVVLLDGTLLFAETAQSSAPYSPTRSMSVLPHKIMPARADSPFGELLKRIWRRYQDGLTAHIPLERYLHDEAKVEPNLTWAVFTNVGTSEEMSLKIGDAVPFSTPTDHIRNNLSFLTRKGL